MCIWGGGREKRNAFWVLVGKPEGKRPLRRPRYWWEDNINIGNKEIGCEGVDWVRNADTSVILPVTL